MRALVLAVVALASAAHAEPWYRGKYGRNRVVHVSITLGAGMAYVVSETILKPRLAATTTRWGSVDSLDASIRNAVVWKDPATATTLSNVAGYAAAPLLSLGLTVAGAATSDDPTVERLIDDTVPVLETAVLSADFDQVVKFVAARQRPYAHFTIPPPPPGNDDNVSFFSGHTTLVFSLATSAGVIAHRRKSWTEPYIWFGGGALAVTTAYLRMAADKHYFTDVLTGATVGTLSGLLVPKLMERQVEVAPTGNGVTVVGVF